jgi:hypothetical protein
MLTGVSATSRRAKGGGARFSLEAQGRPDCRVATGGRAQRAQRGGSYRCSRLASALARPRGRAPELSGAETPLRRVAGPNGVWVVDDMAIIRQKSERLSAARPVAAGGVWVIFQPHTTHARGPCSTTSRAPSTLPTTPWYCQSIARGTRHRCSSVTSETLEAIQRRGLH